jgi:hypothetical protein
LKLNKPQTDTKTLVIAASSNGSFDDLAVPGVLRGLADCFNLCIVAAPKLDPQRLKEYDATQTPIPPRWRRILYNTARGTYHYARRRPFVLNAEHALYRSFVGISDRQRQLIRGIATTGMAKPAGIVCRWLLRVTAPKLIPRDRDICGIIMVTSVESDFSDDITRDARRLGIPMLAVQGNWDNVAMKTFMETPDYLAVWGEQSFLIARFIHNISPYRLFVTGTPRFDGYRNPIDRLAARRKLHLPLDRHLILFCGTSIPFDEHSALCTLGAAAEAGQLDMDTTIYFRPHPERLPRTGEPAFQAMAPYVMDAPTAPEHMDRREFLPTLLAAMDSVISPFSTLAIETAAFGLPALCLAYNDKNHANFDWTRQAYELHNYAFLHGDWCTVVDSPGDIVNGVKELRRLADTNSTAEKARAAAAFVNRFGHEPASERIIEAMMTVIEGRDADRSRELADQFTGRYENFSLNVVRDKDA